MLSLLKPLLYLQLSPDQVVIRLPAEGRELRESADLALSMTSPRRIVAVGTAARLAAADPGVELLRPFSHPRTLVSDFTLGEQLLKTLVRQALKAGWLTPAPEIVMHPLGEPAGGYTQVELRALHEMAMACGASSVHVWTGPVLGDEDLRTRRFVAGARANA